VSYQRLTGTGDRWKLNIENNCPDSKAMWIFLDIDGVLVPDKNKFHGSAIKEDFFKFDPVCQKEFEDVLRLYPEVSVAISSSWREVFPFEVVRPLFSPDISSRVVGFTPFLDNQLIHQFEYLRHQEVLEYLRQNKASDTAWVAIDDVAEHYPPDVCIVVTDAYTGFDSSAAMLLEQLLTLGLKEFETDERFKKEIS
jgi:hypothetical protein